MKPELSVIIETINVEPGNFSYLDGTLAGLEAQTLSPEHLEVVIVFNPGLHPRMQEHVAASRLAITLVEVPSDAHYYQQKLAGARAAKADFIAFVDSDCRPSSTWAETYVNGLAAAAESVAAIQGPIRIEGSFLGQAFAVTNHFVDHETSRPREHTKLGGSNAAYRKEEFLSDPYDDAQVFHGPEVRKAARIRAAGRSILLLPEAAVSHRFLDGWLPFLAHGVYWGHCFARLCRTGADDIYYVGPFRVLGPLAPLGLVPAKAFIDLRSLFRNRRLLGLGWAKAMAASMALMVNAGAVGYGAALAVAGRPTPTAATSSNAHLAAVEAAR